MKKSLSHKWGKLLLNSYSAHTYLFLAEVNSFDHTTVPEIWQSTSNPLYFLYVGFPQTVHLHDLAYTFISLSIYRTAHTPSLNPYNQQSWQFIFQVNPEQPTCLSKFLKKSLERCWLPWGCGHPELPAVSMGKGKSQWCNLFWQLCWQKPQLTKSSAISTAKFEGYSSTLPVFEPQFI